MRVGRDALIAPTFMIDSEDAAGRGRSALRASRKPEDVSFCSRAGELTNPNARALLVADEYRGTHSAAWLTREAARCLLARRAELSRLRSEKKRCEFLLRLDRRPLA
ncbi:MAG: hypothetical protein K6F67_04350, partial [Oscillospiraceae bacterium]|nr:hypothetical protein [Oscillospiraceae bacterium]